MGIMFIRTVILYLLTVVALRVMGKRQIGELEPTELVTTILVSEIATLPLQDMQLPLLFSVVPVFALVGLEMISSVISLNSARYRSFLAGKYNIVINEGKIDIEQMKKAQLTVDELMEELRQHEILDICDVSFCILETSGKMSVIPKTSDQKHLSYSLVVDGRPVLRNLKKLGLTKKDISEVAREHGLGVKGVFLMTVCGEKFTVVAKNK